MTWKFHVYATEQRRLFSRILQVLESQMVIIRSFAGEADHTEICVTFVVSSEQGVGYHLVLNCIGCRCQAISHQTFVRFARLRR